MDGVVLGRAGVELGGAVRRQGHDRTLAIEAPAAAVAVKGRSGVVQNLELAGGDVGKQLSGLLALGQDIDHGVSNRVGLEEGEALGETVDHVAASDLERLHADDAGAGEHAESVLGGTGLFGLFADNRSGQSGGGDSEEGERVDHCGGGGVVMWWLIDVVKSAGPRPLYAFPFLLCTTF